MTTVKQTYALRTGDTNARETRPAWSKTPRGRGTNRDAMLAERSAVNSFVAWIHRVLGRNLTPFERLQRARVPSKVVVLFTRQFETLINAGVPMVQSLDTLSLQEEYPDFGLMVADISKRVSDGNTLSSSLSRFPHVFPKLFAAMISIAERSGNLHECLRVLAEWMEKDSDLTTRIRSALSYPAFIMGTTGLLTLGLFYGVMPSFLSIFEEMHVELPLVTRLVLGFTRLLRNPLAWAAFLAFFFLAKTQLKRAWEDDDGRVFLYRLASAIPVLGDILRDGSSSRYCCAVQALLGSGNNLTSTLRLSAAVSGSPLLEQDVPKIVKSVSDGELLSDHLSRNPEIYSQTIIHFVSAGEEASRMPDMFGRAGDFHQLQMEGHVDALKAALEPIMLGTVALIVGTIIFSIFLPLYGFLNQIG